MTALRQRTLKVGILWTHLSGYMHACVKELASRADVRVFLSHVEAIEQAPFELQTLATVDDCRHQRTPQKKKLLKSLRQFEPDLLLVNSWHLPAHRAACREYSSRAIRILCMDNPWRGRPKQWLGVAVSRIAVKPLYDGVFLPGERQATFAKKLGFTNNIKRGLYTCDWPAFAAAYECRRQSGLVTSRSFAFVGRACRDKGFDILMEAYRLYRDCYQGEWPLNVFGAGDLGAKGSSKNVCQKGFVQPGDLPRALLSSGCLVLPSRFEPWGVAIHEAASMGLPIICSDECGAGVHLVQDGYNGFVVRAGDAKALAKALALFSHRNDNERTDMATRSHEMSRQFSPARWVQAVLEMGHQNNDLRAM